MLPRLARALSPLAIWALGGLWWLLLPVRRNLARQNLHAALPGLPPSTLRRAVGSVAWGYVEALLGVEAEEEGSLPRGPALALSGHGGAWDLALMSFGRRHPVSLYVKQPSNPLAAWALARLRRRSPLQLLDPAQGLEAGRRALDAGRILILVQDQRLNGGQPAPFFGRPAWTSLAFGRLAAERSLPCIGLWPHRRRDGSHGIEVQVLVFDEACWADPLAMTAASQAWVEARVRAHPDGWWWLHDRWKPPR